MSQRRVPGETLSMRLMARGDTGLYRRQMADGGEVWSGPVASRALRAVGARAMTMDSSIIVDQNFDSGDTGDQALYAHERLHQMVESSSTRQHTVRDAEELAAQAVESMVLHRRARGEEFEDIMRDVVHRKKDVIDNHRGGDHGDDAGDDGMDDHASRHQAMMALLRSGKDFFMIVEDVGAFVMENMMRREHTENYRSNSTEFYPLEY